MEPKIYWKTNRSKGIFERVTREKPIFRLVHSMGPSGCKNGLKFGPSGPTKVVVLMKARSTITYNRSHLNERRRGGRQQGNSKIVVLKIQTCSLER